MSEKGTGRGRPRDRRPGDNEKRAGEARSLLATVVCVVGFLLAVAVVVAGILSSGLGGIIPGGVIGVGLGIWGYYLGARRFGSVTVILAILALFFAIAASQCIVPGVGSCDRGLPPVEPRDQNPSPAR